MLGEVKSDLIDLKAETQTRGKRNLNKLTSAYLAGLVDGEGYIGIQKKNTYYRPILKICMTHEPIIRWLHQSFGGYINIRKESVERNSRTSYSWEFVGKNVIPFLKALYPYLRVKKENAENIFIFEKTLADSFDERWIKLGYGRGKVKFLKEDTITQRENLYLKAKELNKRGLWQPERLNNLTPIKVKR